MMESLLGIRRAGADFHRHLLRHRSREANSDSGEKLDQHVARAAEFRPTSHRNHEVVKGAFRSCRWRPISPRWIPGAEARGQTPPLDIAADRVGRCHSTLFPPKIVVETPSQFKAVR